MTGVIKVLGLGDQVVDQYVNLAVMYPGGNALNFAAFARKLGYEASFMGVFGDDRESRVVKAAIDAIGIDRSHCRTEHGVNGCAKVAIIDGERVFLGSNEGGVSSEKPLDCSQADFDYIASFRLVHMGIWGHCDHLLKDVSALGVPVSYDFSDEFTDETLKAVDYVQYGFFSLDMPGYRVKGLLKRLFSPSNRVLVATRGSRSTIAFDGRRFYEMAPRVVKAVDTMAAGDASLTAFLLSHEIEGKGVEESLADAQRFAAQAVQLEGSFGFGVPIQGVEGNEDA
ncbi:PfkB family carbohydrate kinase [Bifidobacterium bombi]|uniref:Carbohydrate kinase, PfkB family n=1 Tax=Bifidobacterium bombi DSM 19703 TaxID=1341695 RepID=A0A080N353_9BIFI|nr:PfkB family carbohydrate kinase [Bifidobacterium bombi]KFF31543.1 carbohydrate kinase, PfkB family [Bifidobacterium bombi DSM 19703]